MNAINEHETSRGKFYTFDVPSQTVSLTYVDQIYPDGKIIQTQFSEEEIELITRAREANIIPQILHSADETSTLRPLATYDSVPYYGMLGDRRRALGRMQNTVNQVDILLTSRKLPDSITNALATIKTNLLPFLPPEKPSLREG